MERRIRRYALFCHVDTYPLGGWSDFRASFATIGQALAFAAAEQAGFDQFHVVDLLTGDEVWSGTVVDLPQAGSRSELLAENEARLSRVRARTNGRFLGLPIPAPGAGDKAGS